MPQIFDLAAGNAALKEYYDDQKVQDETYKNNPTFALTPKDPDTGGKYYPQPVMFEVGQGRSNTFSNAQGNQTAMQYAEFLVTRKSDYAIQTIDNQTLEASLTDKGAFLRFATAIVDSNLRAATISAASSQFRAGTGTIGKISSITSGVITLTNPADVVQFGVNQTLQSNQTDGGTPRAALGYVIARSARNGTITVASSGLGGTAATPSGWTTSDFLLVQGDLNAKPSGYTAWLPMTDPTSTDNFYGVNRSVDYRLFGVQYDGSGQAIEEALVDHSMLMGREGAMPTHYPTNYGSYAAICKALSTRIEYEDMTSETGNISFQAIKLNVPTGPIKVYADRNCQVQSGFMLTMSTWKCISIGEVPKILRYEDRLEMLRVYNADAAECRIGGYYNFLTNAPVFNGQTLLSS